MNKDRVKILFFIDTISGPNGGTERHVLDMIKSLDLEKFQVYLGCLFQSQWLKDYPPVCPQIMLNFKGYWHPNFIWQMFKLVKFLRQERIQILQVFFLEASVIGIMAAALARVPHRIASRRNLGYRTTPARIKIYRLLRPLTTCYLTNCNAVKEYVVFSEKVPEEKVKVIYNSVDTERLRSVWAKKSLNVFPKDKPVVGMVANLKEIKGIKYFLEAAQLISLKDKDVLFVIIGGGYDEEYYREVADQLGLKNTVLFLGIKEDVSTYLGSFSIAVNASLTEGLSNSILEYMAAGLAIVATAVGGNPELIEDGVTGFLVPPADSQALADKIWLLLGDQALRERVSRNARQKAERLFSRERQISELEKFYLDLVGTT